MTTDTDQPRICAACKFHDTAKHGGGEIALCTRDRLGHGVSLVTGQPHYRLRFAEAERGTPGPVSTLLADITQGRDRCGPEGRFYAPKVTAPPKDAG